MIRYNFEKVLVGISVENGMELGKTREVDKLQSYVIIIEKWIKLIKIGSGSSDKRKKTDNLVI